MGIPSGMVRSIRSGNAHMSKLITSACFSVLLFAVPASAYSPSDQSAVPAVSKPPDGKILLLARHGKDDPAGDDHGGRGRGGKGRGGHDDGPNNAESDAAKLLHGLPPAPYPLS